MWRYAAVTATLYSFESRRQGSPIALQLHEPKNPSLRPFLRKADLEVYGQELPPMMGNKVVHQPGPRGRYVRLLFDISVWLRECFISPHI